MLPHVNGRMSQVSAGGSAVIEARRASSSTSASALLAGFAFCAAALAQAPAAAADEAVERSEQQDFRIETLAAGLDHPWSLAFLPDGGLLITERAGRLRLFKDGGLLEEPIAGGPEVSARGQGGLFDVVLHPDFGENG